MDDSAFEENLPEDLRGIADALSAGRDVPDGHQLDRVQRRVAAGRPRRWTLLGRRQPSFAAGGLLLAAVLTVGLAQGSLGQVVSSLTDAVTSGTNAPPAATTVYCQDGSQNDCTCPNPPVGYPTLGDAAKYTVFALNDDTTETGTFSLVTVNGDVAVGSGATIDNMKPSAVDGNVYLDSTSPPGTFTGPGTVTGSITSTNLSGARSAAFNASTAAAGLTATASYTSITSPTTVTGGPGLNVVDIAGDIGSSLTLTGPSNAFFVVNVGGNITLGGTDSITVGGATPADQLLINMTGTGMINTHVGDVIEGTLLAPYTSGNSQLDGTFGSLLIGGDFTLLSGATVTYGGCGGGSGPPPPTATPLTPGAWFSSPYYKGLTTSLLTEHPQDLGGYVVSTYSQAQAIFKAMNCGASTDEGAVGCLAGHLLAAELNVVNGAPVPTCASTAISQANALLTTVGYTGPTGTYTLTASQRSTATSLNTTLNGYDTGKGNTC